MNASLKKKRQLASEFQMFCLKKFKSFINDSTLSIDIPKKKSIWPVGTSPKKSQDNLETDIKKYP